MNRTIAVMSDIHANLEALQSAIYKIEEQNITEIFFLGDVVGYGPDPNECIQLLKEKNVKCISGNHEAIILNNIKLKENVPGTLCSVSTDWTARNISEDSLALLRKYGTGEVYGTSVSMQHTQLLDHAFPYLNRTEEIINAFPDPGIHLYGHTHRPRLTRCGTEGNIIQDSLILDKEEYILSYDEKIMINVGSVGQARADKTICNFVTLTLSDMLIVNYYFEEYDSKTTYEKVKKAMGMDMAAYLIREEWRRKEYESDGHRG